MRDSKSGQTVDSSARKAHERRHALKMTSAATGAAAVTMLSVFGPPASTKPSAMVGKFPLVIDGCGLDGKESPGTEKAKDNNLKNRFTFPEEGEIEHSINFDLLRNAPISKNPNQEKAAEIDGYIWYVKPGGQESCNCKTTHPEFFDTHIYVSSTPNGPKGASRTYTPDSRACVVEAQLTPEDRRLWEQQSIIVEVTPRIRKILSEQGIDWTTTTLVKNLTGQRVHISGWLFCDKEHKASSKVDNPNGKDLWRASCWEIHPVTRIEILDERS